LTVDFFPKIWRFGKYDPLRGNFQNSVPKRFIATPINVLCANFVKFGRPEIGELVRYLPDKKNKISLRFLAVASARIAPKICRASARQCTQSGPDFIQIGSFSAEL